MRIISGTLCVALLLTTLATVTASAGTEAPPAVKAAPVLTSPLTPAPLVQTPMELAKAETAQTVRIGYLDTTRIGSESVQGKAAQARFKAKAEKYQSQIKAREKQLEKQKAAIEAKLPTLLPEQRAAKAREFEKKVEEYRRFVQNAEKELKPLEEELGRSLIETVEKVVADYGKANGYAAIVAKRELLYQGSGVAMKDLTDDILKRLNEMGEKK